MKKSSNFPSHTTSDSHLLTKNLPSKISHCCPRWHGNSPTWKALEVLWANQYDPRANSLKAIANCTVRQAQIFYFDIIFLTWQVTTAIISTILWTGVPHIVGNKPKGWISKLVFQENKARQIFRKTNISYPLIRTRTGKGVRNVRFPENLRCFFLKHPFWYSPFCLITNVLSTDLSINISLNLSDRWPTVI